MKKYCLLVLSIFLLFPFTAHAQPVDISVNVQQAFSPQARLLMFDGQGYTVVDSSLQISQGSYGFTLPSGFQKGMYRVDVGKNIKLNLVVGDETSIDVNTVVFAPEDSLRSAQSVENNTYWRFQRQKELHSQRGWLIRSLMDYYPDSSTFRNNLQVELQRLNHELNRFAEKLIQTNQNLLVSSYIKLEQRPVTSDSKKNELTKLVATWWNSIDLHNPLIKNSPALRDRVWAYMENFFNDDFYKEEQDREFTRGTYALLELPMDIEVKRAIRDILINGFVDSDYQDVYEYLQYTAFDGLDPLKKSESKEKLKRTVRAKVGEKALDFLIEPLQGKSINLSKIKADYKLVLFWSSWCPHCIDAMPRILEIYNRYKDLGFEVIAVSLDDEPISWERYVNDLNINWINVRIPYSPDNDVYATYDVHETPRMFLLGKNLEIISKPSTIRQLEVRLRRAICR